MVIKTKAKLITSYKIKAAKVDIDGNPTGELVDIGQMVNINVTESRSVIQSYVIGNEPNSGDPQEIVPGIVTTRQFTSDYVTLYDKTALEDLGRTPDIASLTQQLDPFIVQEIITDPSGNVPVRVKQYNDCYITNYAETKNISGGDIRVLESVTVTYRNVTLL